MEWMRITAFLLLFAGLGVLLTWGLSRLKSRLIKYFPGILLILIALVLWLYARLGNLEGFLDLAYFLMAILVLAAGLGGLITAIFIDRVSRRR